MKVSNHVQNMLKVYSESKPKQVVKTDKPNVVGKDEVILSSQAQEVLALRQKLKDIPAVRAEKVEAFKVQIETGTYKVDTKELAEKVFNSLLSKN